MFCCVSFWCSVVGSCLYYFVGTCWGSVDVLLSGPVCILLWGPVGVL